MMWKTQEFTNVPLKSVVIAITEAYRFTETRSFGSCTRGANECLVCDYFSPKNGKCMEMYY